MRVKSLARAACLAVLSIGAGFGQGELRFSIRSDPKTFDPLLAGDEASETVRYLTGATLIRIDRRTQEFKPELAESWRVSAGGARIAFKLREGIRFPDGTPFSSADVAYTFRRVMDPNLHSPVGDSFRTGPGEIRTEAQGPSRITVIFPAPLAGVERLFDQLTIVSSHSSGKEPAGLGPFVLGEHKPGAYLLFRRNPNYWKKDAAGRRLPYLDSLRADIQQNRDLEMVRFRRGEVQLIDTLDPELFDRLAADSPAEAKNAGASLESEMLWFNQVASAPLPAYKKAWFRSKDFRRAISSAINRGDLCRLAYKGHAEPAAGPVSPANRAWVNAKLAPHAFDPEAALARLKRAGFTFEQGALRDRERNLVEFSLVTNSGNKARARIAALIQQDLAKTGIRLNVVALDFPSLIERMTRTYDYEACLLGLVNVDLDPNSQMNVWLSSAANHQWNPKQKAPETPWEAEIDRLMLAQSSAIDPKKRKAAFDRVQEIVWEEAPFLYLVNKHALSAVSRSVLNVSPVALWPRLYWNPEVLQIAGQVARSRR
jgi:peptide/nickel transport system substrate-binding protein